MAYPSKDRVGVTRAAGPPPKKRKPKTVTYKRGKKASKPRVGGRKYGGT